MKACESCQIIEEVELPPQMGCTECFRLLCNSYETLEKKDEHLDDLVYELEQNLLAAQDQNHYFLLLGEYRDKNFELEKKYDKMISQLVSYEATIGHLKEALEDISTRGTGTGGAAFVTTSTLRDIARNCLGGLKK